MTVGSPRSSTAMQLFVVPRSIPMVLAIWFRSSLGENLSRSVSRLERLERADELGGAECEQERRDHVVEVAAVARAARPGPLAERCGVHGERGAGGDQGDA